MGKEFHEFRDPIHNFIQVTSDERKVIDSRPFQRLRHIHQLALTYLVYPGATHKRFEHSIGVMELAGKVFDVVTSNIVHNFARKIIPNNNELSNWRSVIRIAALCHDIGHLPFSHAAEDKLLPENYNHEKLTVDFIKGDEMEEIWKRMDSPMKYDSTLIAKLAVGPEKYPDENFNDWETILSEIITGKAFGVDRMDYLLRDSYHAGVAYGKFDIHRLVSTLRILPSNQESEELELGVESGGIHSAEALVLARYFMFKQVYFHPVRRIYDIHLKEFLTEWLGGGSFSTVLEDHLMITDNEVNTAILETSINKDKKGHISAKRIVERNHFKLIYDADYDQTKENPNLNPAKTVFERLKSEYGEENVRYDEYKERDVKIDFPVLTTDKKIVSFYKNTKVLDKPISASLKYVFIASEKRNEAEKWLEENMKDILTSNETKEKE